MGWLSNLFGGGAELTSEQERLIAEARRNVAASEATWTDEHKNINRVAGEQLRKLEEGAKVRW